jgi:hypothetical protein
MQLPPIDRTPHPRLAGVEAVSPVVQRVAPVSAPESLNAEPSPSVINKVSQLGKAVGAEAVYTSVSDPARRGSEAATAPKDWTIRRPEPQKVEDPPPVPLSRILMDHLRAIWTASATAVQVQEPVLEQVDPAKVKPNPNVITGTVATEVLTYSPSKINKTEKL